MKRERIHRSPGTSRALLGALAIVLVALTSPATSLAASGETSGGSTIFNEVTVTYDFGTVTNQTAKASATVTVSTLPAAPTVTVDTNAQSTLENGAVDYVYTLVSNANGPDDYTASVNTTTPTNVGAPSSQTFTASPLTLWGGTIVACAGVAQGANQVCIPAGAETGLSGSETVIINIGGSDRAYSVSTITAGTAKTSGAAEVTTRLTLADDIDTHGVDASTAATGTPIGEYGTINFTLTAGTLNAGQTTGDYVTTLDFTTTATDLGGSTVTATSAGVTTTVLKQLVTITKAADVANAKPGETITYTITVANDHPSQGITGVSITDPVPAYTTYVGNSTRLNGITVAGDGGASPLAGGLAIDADGGRAAGATATGNLASGETATIIFKVTVD